MTDDIDVTTELVYATSRSSGAGGQHVNKVETKVEARFNITASSLLTPYQKGRLLDVLSPKLVDDGSSISLYCQATRSQLKNKILVTKMLNELINQSLEEQKVRVPTRKPRAVVMKILKDKVIKGQRKSLRGNLKHRRDDLQ